MPEEIEVETKELQETIDEMREEREERAREARETAWTRWISLSTALLAVFAAIAALQAGRLVNEALIAKNNSVLNQARASDQWAYYQAKGIKGNGATQTADLLSANPAQSELVSKWRAEAKRYKAEQEETREKATELEQERDKDNTEAAELMHSHEIFAYCVTFLQVAIALSAIAALTRQKLIWYLSMLVGLAGLIYFGNGFIVTGRAAAHRPAEVGAEYAPSSGKEAPPGKREAGSAGEPQGERSNKEGGKSEIKGENKEESAVRDGQETGGGASKANGNAAGGRRKAGE